MAAQLKIEARRRVKETGSYEAQMSKMENLYFTQFASCRAVPTEPDIAAQIPKAAKQNE